MMFDPDTGDPFAFGCFLVLLALIGFGLVVAGLDALVRWVT